MVSPAASFQGEKERAPAVDTVWKAANPRLGSALVWFVEGQGGEECRGAGVEGRHRNGSGAQVRADTFVDEREGLKRYGLCCSVWHAYVCIFPLIHYYSSRAFVARYQYKKERSESKLMCIHVSIDECNWIHHAAQLCCDCTLGLWPVIPTVFFIFLRDSDFLTIQTWIDNLMDFKQITLPILWDSHFWFLRNSKKCIWNGQRQTLGNE